MKRILVLLMVALIMAAMMAASAMPAFAANPNAVDHACNHAGGASHAPFCTI
jgi:hypothetical protein